MTETDSRASPTSGKGKAFFDRAEQVAETGNWDFAIELYLEGIQREPANLVQGHKPLRVASMNRKAQGGKGPGMMETFKRRSGKDPLQNLINAEYLLAKEPGSIQYMVQFRAAAEAMELGEVVAWMDDILLESQRQAAKPDKRILMLLTDSYTRMEDFGKASQACEMARQLTPDDASLQEILNELSAKYTIKKGRYSEDGGDFTRSVKDLDKQKELIQKDMLVQNESFLQQQAEKARQEYAESPTVPGKINSYVDALLKLAEEGSENEAMDVLAKAYKDTGAYQFKMRVGDIRIRQLSHRLVKCKEASDKEAAHAAAKELLEFELKEYTERAANYPTDMAIKFDLGLRQYRAAQMDEAIGSLQQAQRDPRRHIQALTYLGLAFAKKGWHREAADTFQRALQNELTEERAKELRYNLGVVLQHLGDMEKAQHEFSQIAQLDYNYRDVRQRLEEIRKKLQSDQQGGQ